MKATFKKASVFAIAISLVVLMALSVMPMMVSAAEEPDFSTFKVGTTNEANLNEKLSAMNVSLSGQITLKFFFTGLTDDHSYVKVTVPQQNGDPKTTTISKSALTTSVKNEETRYEVNVSVAAAQQTDLVTVQWYNKNGVAGKSRSYSVKYYADKVIELAETDETYTDMSQNVKGMLNYGAIAQLQFGYNTKFLANKDLYDETNNPINNMIVDDLRNVEDNEIASSANIVFKGVQVFLQDTFRMRIYVDAPAGATATINDQAVALQSDEYGTYVSKT